MHGTLPAGWRSLGLRYGKGEDLRFFELVPSDTEREIAWQGFHVRGTFKIARRVRNPNRAADEWKAFKAE